MSKAKCDCGKMVFGNFWMRKVDLTLVLNLNMIKKGFLRPMKKNDQNVSSRSSKI